VYVARILPLWSHEKRECYSAKVAKYGNFWYFEMSLRRHYKIDIEVNRRRIRKVIVDPHYEAKHPEINDFLILRLVALLDGNEYPEDGRKGSWAFFSLDPIELMGRHYRLVWCLRDEEEFLGVINSFRR